ncbi:MAG TPA: tetratricopeptide repeat protein [Candidatus Koribacter sp.]|jgi:tetratricopeptide (TPR) repeat protein
MAKQSAQVKRPSSSPSGAWTSTQSYVLAAITLIVGIGIGWLLHGSYTDNNSVAAATTSSTTQPSTFSQSSPRLTVGDVNSAAAPMLAKLEQRPNDPDLLAQIGNLYYDSQVYAQAIEYYQKALNIRPNDPDVRTDMGTAMWYSGDADGALREFAKSLSYNPSHNGTLFNRGVVLFQGKKDSKGAIASWQELLRVNPNYPDRAKVEQMIQEAKQKS